MLFALSRDLQVFKPACEDQAIWYTRTCGPCFRKALSLEEDPLNSKHGGLCRTKNRDDDGKYNVGETEKGASVLTGGSGRFTCIELEVFLIE